MENPLVPNQTATRKLNVEQWLELAESLAEAENPLERALVLLGEEGAARSIDRAQRVAEYELDTLIPSLDSNGVAELAEVAESVQSAEEQAAASPEFAGVLAQAILAELSEMYTPALVAAVLEGKETGAGLVKSMHALVEEAPVESEGMLTKDAEARVRTMLREFLEQEETVAEPVEELFEAEEDVEDVDEGDWVPRAFPTAGASPAPRTPSQSWSTAGFLGARPLEQNTKEKNSAMSVLDQLSRQFGKKR
uniref:Expressed protein n=2 Tax=Schizophyllum commune (strain H4-8 / FGSC 9210) TaxID=578458 RepID=D8PUV1_SCHCM